MMRIALAALLLISSAVLSQAQRAARRAKFTPTLLSGQPVKVAGVVTYNFVAQ